MCASHIRELGPLVDGQLSQSPKQVGLSQSPLTNLVHEFPACETIASVLIFIQLDNYTILIFSDN